MKVCVCLSLFLFCFVACERPRWYELDDKYTFEQYKIDFAKSYPTPEENEIRREMFTKSLRSILTHNQRKSSYRMGVNHMTDWTAEEKKKLLGYDQGLGHRQVRERDAAFKNGERERPSFGGDRTVPLSVDWRENSILTAVKDQGLISFDVAYFLLFSFLTFSSLSRPMRILLDFRLFRIHRDPLGFSYRGAVRSLRAADLVVCGEPFGLRRRRRVRGRNGGVGFFIPCGDWIGVGVEISLFELGGPQFLMPL